VAKRKTQHTIFVSYSSFDDQHDDGKLSALCQRLTEELRVQTGDDYSVFLDRKKIRTGDNWRTAMQAALDASDVFVAFITPSYLNDRWCRSELEGFLDKERRRDQKGIIVPIMYMGHEGRMLRNPLGKTIAERQPLDWRDLRFEPFTSIRLKREMHKAATAIGGAIEAAGSEE